MQTGRPLPRGQRSQEEAEESEEAEEGDVQGWGVGERRGREPGGGRWGRRATSKAEVEECEGGEGEEEVA